MIDDYSDIINLPHPESKKHIRMTKSARAAQFSPFAALKGYDEAIEESNNKKEENIYTSLFEESESEM